MKGEMDMYFVRSIKEEFLSESKPPTPNDKFWLYYNALKSTQPEPNIAPERIDLYQPNLA